MAVVLLTCLTASHCLADGATVQEEIQETIENKVAQDREKDAAEDPLILRQSEKIDSPNLQAIKPNSFSLYTSLRMRYRDTSGQSILGDGGTRVGINGEYQFMPSYWILGRIEEGIRVFDNLDQIFDPGSQNNDVDNDNIFLRLGYVAVETPRTFLSYGKNWSTYYQVASFTDRFQGTGASASGTFNAGTDGGPSGTGRADSVFQTRLHIPNGLGSFLSYKPFNLNIQFQPGEKIPHAEENRYRYSAGLSAIVERENNLKVGIALNYAPVDKDDLKQLQEVGIDGDDVSVLLGVQWFGQKWYVATVFSWLQNHMATQSGIYFDAWGSEGYAHYQLRERLWLVGGWNYLEPLAGESQAGDYVLRYGVLGLRYTFKEFQRMIYANIRFDNSHAHFRNTEDIGNTYTVGIRWDFDW